MIMVTMPALGIPGAPNEAIIAVRQTITCWVMDNSKPIKLAIKSAAAAS